MRRASSSIAAAHSVLSGEAIAFLYLPRSSALMNTSSDVATLAYVHVSGGRLARYQRLGVLTAVTIESFRLFPLSVQVRLYLENDSFLLDCV